MFLLPHLGLVFSGNTCWEMLVHMWNLIVTCFQLAEAQLGNQKALPKFAKSLFWVFCLFVSFFACR